MQLNPVNVLRWLENKILSVEIEIIEAINAVYVRDAFCKRIDNNLKILSSRFEDPITIIFEEL
jgi:hypothetical protein